MRSLAALCCFVALWSLACSVHGLAHSLYSLPHVLMPSCPHALTPSRDDCNSWICVLTVNAINDKKHVLCLHYKHALSWNLKDETVRDSKWVFGGREIRLMLQNCGESADAKEEKKKPNGSQWIRFVTKWKGKENRQSMWKKKHCPSVNLNWIDNIKKCKSWVPWVMQ